MYKKVNRLIRFTPVNRRECISGSRRNSGVNRICLKYIKKSNGYLLYSLGPDRTDQAGQKKYDLEKSYQDKQGDIVFSVSE